jgi:hydroxypyruvate isomerase
MRLSPISGVGSGRRFGLPRLSANLGFLWPDRPLIDRIHAAAAAGFEAVEMHWPYDVPAEEIRAACGRLSVIGINTPVGDAKRGDFGLGALPGREEEFQAAFDLSLGYARTIRANAIHAMAGVVPAELKEAGRATLIANLREALRKAESVTVLLEPINPRDKPDYFYSRLEEAVAVIREVDASNLKLMFDVYHVAVAEGDVTRKLENYLPLIGHVQIAAVPSRAEPDEGEINYADIFATLGRIGYNGWVGCEYRPRGRTEDGLVWRDRIAS